VKNREREGRREKEEEEEKRGKFRKEIERSWRK